MKRYENRIIPIEGTVTGQEPLVREILNELGEGGWRPWHLLYDGRETLIFMVREIED